MGSLRESEYGPPMIPDIQIRRFQRGDGPRVREIHETAMAQTPEWIPEIPDEDLQDVRGQYLDADGEFLVGVVDDALVAMGAYTTPDDWKDAYQEIDDTTVELTRMRVDPEYQGQGFGTALYRDLKRRARRAGYERFVLDTGARNEVARGFYERLGFECVREISVDYREQSLELALYQKQITN